MRITCTNNLPKVGKRMAQIVEAVRALSDSQGYHGVFVADVIRKAYPERSQYNGFCYAAVKRCVKAGVLDSDSCTNPATGRWGRTLWMPGTAPQFQRQGNLNY